MSENPPWLPNETTDEYVLRVYGPTPDTELDESRDFKSLNLPKQGSREDRESLGGFDHEIKRIIK